ncbi:MAG: L,D-transpeptidase [Bacilli bacterium]
METQNNSELNDEEITQSLDETLVIDITKPIEGLAVESETTALEVEEDSSFIEEEAQLIDTMSTNDLTKTPNKKRLIALILSLFIVVVYGLVTVYFSLNVKASIVYNNQNYDLLSTKQLEDQVSTNIDQYLSQPVNLVIDQNNQYPLNISKIASYQTKSIKKSLNKQYNAFLWPMYVMEEPTIKLNIPITIDQKLLNQELNNLNFFNNEGRIPSIDAYLQLDDNGFSIVESKTGTMIDEKKALTSIEEGINSNTKDIKMDDAYIKANIQSDDLKTLLKDANDFVATSIILKNNDIQYTVTKKEIGQALIIDYQNKSITTSNESSINSLLKVNEDFATTQGGSREVSVSFYQGVASYLGNDTRVNLFTFTEDNVTTYQNAINNKQDIVMDLELHSNYDNITYINESHSIKTESRYYIEVDISMQTLWLYDGANVILRAPVITGNESKNTPTLRGEFAVMYKQRDTRLVGNTVGFTGADDYDVPVSYWMPFESSGSGFHDNYWVAASNFGTSFYQTSGSHGCVNLLPNHASILYSYVSSGTAVWIYN